MYVVRLKVPAGYKIAAHTHPNDENVTVLSGSFNIGTGDKLDDDEGRAGEGRRLFLRGEGHDPLRVVHRGDRPAAARHRARRASPTSIRPTIRGRSSRTRAKTRRHLTLIRLRRRDAASRFVQQPEGAADLEARGPARTLQPRVLPTVPVCVRETARHVGLDAAGHAALRLRHPLDLVQVRHDLDVVGVVLGDHAFGRGIGVRARWR